MYIENHLINVGEQKPLLEYRSLGVYVTATSMAVGSQTHGQINIKDCALRVFHDVVITPTAMLEYSSTDYMTTIPYRKRLCYYDTLISS